jgi:GT2 family glycosyltransferase
MKNKLIKYSIGLVYFDGKNNLLMAIESILKQSFSSYEILVKDNSLNQEVEDIIKSSFFCYIKNKKIKIFKGLNIMHSAGHNVLISYSKGLYYICGSIDMLYKSKMLEYLNDDIQKDYFIYTGKLINESNTIDSTGIFFKSDFRWYDRGQGENIKKYSQDEEVEGVTGALFCIEKYKIKIISLKFIDDKICKRYEFFDESIHYKNDVELACRIKLRGFKCWYNSNIYAVHNRNISKKSKKSLFVINSSIKGQYEILKRYSFSKIIPFHKSIFAWFSFFISYLRKIIY